MNNIQKRFILFLFGCVIVRLLLVYFITQLSTRHLQWTGIVALVVAASWVYIYLTNSRKTGPEVFGESIWWNHLRPVHALLYLLFAIFALRKDRNAWKFLVVDVSLGLTAFLYHHYTSGSFSQLF